ncbi:hypothetical protein P8452_41849 [Trifolium repens]|nr:hypothetical protein P8452_41849 [Trifolium repens]
MCSCIFFAHIWRNCHIFRVHVENLSTTMAKITRFWNDSLDLQFVAVDVLSFGERAMNVLWDLEAFEPLDSIGYFFPQVFVLRAEIRIIEIGSKTGDGWPINVWQDSGPRKLSPASFAVLASGVAG